MNDPDRIEQLRPAHRVALPNVPLSAFADMARMTIRAVGIPVGSEGELVTHCMTAMLVLAHRHPAVTRDWYDAMLAAAGEAHVAGHCDCADPERCCGVWGQMADTFVSVLPS